MFADKVTLCTLKRHTQEDDTLICFCKEISSLVNIIDELDNLRVLRLVQVHIWGTVWVVCWHDELKANWSLLVVNLNGHLASDL